MEKNIARYHGWWVVFCCFAIALYGWGFGFYGLSLYLVSLRKIHGWSPATISAVTADQLLTEPVTTIRLDTPAGLVVADVDVADGRAERVTIRNVASFVTELDARVEVPGYGPVRYDMAYGGNFYAQRSG